MYTFERLEEQQGFRYTAKSKVNKHRQSIYYRSFSSLAEDTNKCTYDKLRLHKQTIDYAIRYVEKQYRAGMSHSMMLYPESLNKKYRYYVYTYVKNKVNNNNEIKEHTFQPYWVYGEFIKHYEFRKDKDRSSKFQCFVEFEPSYSETDTIKVNLRMNKQGYDNRNTLYRDGFDLVYVENNVKVRHVSEQVVDFKADNNIERHIVIDAWGNLHSALVDKREETTNDKGQPRFNESKHVVCAKYEKVKCSKKMNSLLQSLTTRYSEQDSEFFKSRISRIIDGLKIHTRNLIGSDNETSVKILMPSKFESNIYKALSKAFYDEANSTCSKLGIRCQTKFVEKHKIDTIVKKHKTETKNYKNRAKHGIDYKESEHTKWKDFLIASLRLNYNTFYPILTMNRKSSYTHCETTDENGCQVLEKPAYPSWEEYQQGYDTLVKEWPTEFKPGECRKNYVEHIMLMAQEFLVKKQKFDGTYVKDEIQFI